MAGNDVAGLCNFRHHRNSPRLPFPSPIRHTHEGESVMAAMKVVKLIVYLPQHLIYLSRKYEKVNAMVKKR